MTQKTKILLATKNVGKLREMQNAFADLPVELAPLGSLFADLPEPVEDGATFTENALIKARYYAEKTHYPCLADDSGLEVAALGNAPGVLSARFAGYHADDAANNAKLLAELAKANAKESAAAYRCVLAYVDEKREILTEGTCRGTIKTAAKGSGGFGYDPYFYVGDKTLAQLSLAEKDKISHRGQALRAMAIRLKEILP